MEIKEKVTWFVGIVVLLFLLYLGTAEVRSIINRQVFQVRQADDLTNYETLKTVEDTCRAMVSSYKADVQVYMQYKDADGKEQRSWADQAKIRANKTATLYNEYILKNSFVWGGNVPEDIKSELAYIE